MGWWKKRDILQQESLKDTTTVWQSCIYMCVPGVYPIVTHSHWHCDGADAHWQTGVACQTLLPPPLPHGHVISFKSRNYLIELFNSVEDIKVNPFWIKNFKIKPFMYTLSQWASNFLKIVSVNAHFNIILSAIYFF